MSAGLSNESQLPAQLAWDLLASPEGVPQDASQPDSFLLPSFLCFLKSQALKRSHKFNREGLRNILISFPCHCCWDPPDSENGYANSTVLLKVWVLCVPNKPECFTLNNWAALYPRGPGCCQWAQGSEDARSPTRKVLPMRNPGPTSVPGLSSSCSQRCKERDMEKWQRCSSWCSQSEQQEIPWQNLSFFCVKFAL